MSLRKRRRKHYSRRVGRIANEGEDAKRKIADLVLVAVGGLLEDINYFVADAAEGISNEMEQEDKNGE